jgi:hypothetical protein
MVTTEHELKNSWAREYLVGRMKELIAEISGPFPTDDELVTQIIRNRISAMSQFRFPVNRRKARRRRKKLQGWAYRNTAPRELWT